MGWFLYDRDHRHERVNSNRNTIANAILFNSFMTEAVIV